MKNNKDVDMTRAYSKMNTEDLVRLVSKGDRAKEAMAPGGFLHDVLVPELEQELGEIEGSLVWKPGDPADTVERVGVDRIWKSGISFGMAKVWAHVNRLKNEGMEARKELERRG